MTRISHFILFAGIIACQMILAELYAQDADLPEPWVTPPVEEVTVNTFRQSPLQPLLAMGPDEKLHYKSYSNKATETRILFEDPMTRDWRENRLLDGKKATLRNTENGLFFSGETVTKSDDPVVYHAHHAMLRTQKEFEGDTGKAQTYARFVPERKDDFAWENDMIAFRAYGPALRERPENSGIDAWLKRVEYPIINKWYKEAEEGKSYHKDHGEGLDNYHVGSSAGCGGTGIWLNGEREPLETFIDYEVIEVSPERSRFKLIYERQIDGVVYGEEKTITIEPGKRLFQVESVFLKDQQPAANLPVCIGLTTHDGKAEAFFNRNEGWIATWESLGESELGTGARMDPAHIDSIVLVDRETKDESHIFLITNTDAEGRISYEAGYGWKKAGTITTPDDWRYYLSNK